MRDYNVDKTFISYSFRTQNLSPGPKACPLLPPSTPTSSTDTPAFVSFCGPSGSGKSSIIKALLQNGDVNDDHLPLVRGQWSSVNGNVKRKGSVFRTFRKKEVAQVVSDELMDDASTKDMGPTTSDINLYAAPVTIVPSNPILYLDTESTTNGTSVPSTLHAKIPSNFTHQQKNLSIQERKVYVEQAYPRILYNFSTVIIFVSSADSMKKVQEEVEVWCRTATSGCQNQKFNPALLLTLTNPNIFKYDPTVITDSDGTSVPLASHITTFFSTVDTIHLPDLRNLSSLSKVLTDRFSACISLRTQYALNLNSDNLTKYLQHALKLYSQDPCTVYDWVTSGLASRKIPTSFNEILSGFWVTLEDELAIMNSADRIAPTIDPAIQFRTVLTPFLKHLQECVKKYIRRNPLPGVHKDKIPNELKNGLVDFIEVLKRDRVRCSAKYTGSVLGKEKSIVYCGSFLSTHQNHVHEAGGVKWPAEGFEPSIPDSELDELVDKLERSLSDDTIPVHEAGELPRSVSSNFECLSCLMESPTTFLSCSNGHAICHSCLLDCLSEKEKKNLHLVQRIRCPLCGVDANISPRLMPKWTGTRILTLDGGGVRGITQITMLKGIEEKCLDIPIVWLFDFLVGTSIGGMLALSLTSGNIPYSLKELSTLFPELMRKGFKPHVPIFDSFNMLAVMVGGAKFTVGSLEETLKNHFGRRPVISGPAKGGPGPRVAVTTVSSQNLTKHLVPNYNRKVADDEEILLVRPKNEDCMKVWQAGRCTSAAYPYFPSFPWQSDMLLDGGFAMNNCAKVAYDEAAKIWENRRCDLLLSIGTGTKPRPKLIGNAARNNSISRRWSLYGSNKSKNENGAGEGVNLLKVGSTVIDVAMDSARLWKEFQEELETDQQQGIEIPSTFRFDFSLSKQFKLDDTAALPELTQQAQEFLKTKDANQQMEIISNDLLAKLFYYEHRTKIVNHTHTGVIRLHLPPNLPERTNLINRLIQIGSTLPSNEYLFRVRYLAPQKKIGIDAPSLDILKRLKMGDELEIPVTLPNIPERGDVRFVVEARNIYGTGYNTVSGNPVVLRGEGEQWRF